MVPWVTGSMVSWVFLISWSTVPNVNGSLVPFIFVSLGSLCPRFSDSLFPGERFNIGIGCDSYKTVTKQLQNKPSNSCQPKPIVGHLPIIIFHPGEFSTLILN